MEKSLCRIFDEVARRLGLDAFETTIVHDPATLCLSLRFTRHIEYDRGIWNGEVKPICEKVLGPIFDRVRASPFVVDALAKLTTERDELRAEVERLRPFETYYRLAFAMEHGDCVDKVPMP